MPHNQNAYDQFAAVQESDSSICVVYFNLKKKKF